MAAPKPATAVQAITPAQATALRALHAYLDAQAIQGPGQPDTPALREARQLRTAIAEAFGSDLWPPSA